jgi:hypothetical protein
VLTTCFNPLINHDQGLVFTFRGLEYRDTDDSLTQEIPNHEIMMGFIIIKPSYFLINIELAFKNFATSGIKVLRKLKVDS